MADYKIKFSADTREAIGGINNMSNAVAGIRSSVSLLNTAIAGVAIGKLVGFGASIIKGSSEAAASVETLKIQLKVLTGSAETANSLFQEMTQYTAETPFEQGDIQSAVKMLLTFGIASEDVMGIVKQLGDVSGGQGEKLQSLSRAFGQMSSAGKASLEDINQMIDAGFNPLSEITRTTGISMGELRDKISAGEVGVKAITDAMTSATGSGGRFNGMLREMSGTTEGKLSNISDAVTQLKVAFGTSFNIGLKPILDSLIQAIPQFESAFASMGAALQPILASVATAVKEIAGTFDKTFKAQGLGAAVSEMFKNAIESEAIKSAIIQLGVLLGDGIKQSITGIISQLSTTEKIAIAPFALAGVVLAITKIQKFLLAVSAILPSTPATVGGVALGAIIADLAVAAAIGGGIGYAIGVPLSEQVFKEPSDLGPSQKFIDRINAANAAIRQNELDNSAKKITDAKFFNEAESSILENRKTMHAKYISDSNKIIEDAKAMYAKSHTPEINAIVDSVRGAMLGGLDATGSNLADILLNPEAQGMTRTPVPPLPITKFEGYSPMQTSRSALGLGQFYSGKDTLASMQKIANDYLAKIAKNTQTRMVPSWS